MIKLLLYVLLAAGAAALADLLTRRLATRGECVLHRALLLRDTCQGKCPGAGRCETVARKPYWLGGVQAAGCGCSDPKPRRLPASPEGAEPPTEREDA
ncbi:MAG: hypothetical protein AAF763_02070 [Pseudomonadota bacterium]